MDKETLSNYGWIVICVLVLAVMIALATPFGSFIAGAVENTTEGLFGASQKAMNQTRLLNIADQEMEATPTINGEKESGIIPEGVIYKTGYIYDEEKQEFVAENEIVLQAGDHFPKTIKDGDFYIYNNYEYRYNAYADTTSESWTHLKDWWYYETISEGWGMHYIGEGTNRPNDPLTSVLGKKITAANAAFFLHLEIEYAPAIPDTVENMSYAFSRCENLKEAPRMPSELTEMAFGFFDCYELEQPPILTNCTKLKNVESAFWDCYKLKTLPVLPNSVNSAMSLFSDCYAIVDASDFIIPPKVIDAYNMFAYCENLKYAPVIPETVTEGIMRTFQGCTSLEGTITINANILDDKMQYEDAFDDVDMSKITLAGKCSTEMKQKLANTGKNGSKVTITE